jgi:nucleotide-binding universal stress UspA family protein
MNTRTVVVALDSVTGESFRSNTVLLWAVRHFIKQDDQVVLIHATKSLPGAAQSNSNLLNADAVSELQKSVSSTCQSLFQFRPHSVQIVKGDPREVLLQAVESHKADAIIVGSRGVGTMKR